MCARDFIFIKTCALTCQLFPPSILFILRVHPSKESSPDKCGKINFKSKSMANKLLRSAFPPIASQGIFPSSFLFSLLNIRTQTLQVLQTQRQKARTWNPISSIMKFHPREREHWVGRNKRREDFTPPSACEKTSEFLLITFQAISSVA